jgi:hypothetical protein
MSSKSKISKSTRDIISILIENGFSPMTLKDISKRMAALGNEVELTALNQRIIRDQGGFFVSDEGKPKRVGLNINKTEIHVIRYRNRCQICGETKSSEKLEIRDVNRIEEDVPTEWARRITCCHNCMQTPWEESKVLQRSKAKPLDEKRTGESKYEGSPRWEYLRVEIRQRFQSTRKASLYTMLGSLSPPEGFNYYAFRDPNDDEWRYLVDNQKRITSIDITDVLDHYGNNGWELVHMRLIGKDRRDPNAPLFVFENMPLDEYECIFKRQADESNEEEE